MHLEITAAMVHDNEKRTEAELAEMRRRIDRVVGIVEPMTDAITSLGNTAAKREVRIERLEGQ